MVTARELRDSEHVVRTAQMRLREIAFKQQDDDLLEIAESLIGVETSLRTSGDQFAKLSGKLQSFDRERDLEDLDQVLLSLRGFLSLPDPGVLKIAGWVTRAAPPA